MYNIAPRYHKCDTKLEIGTREKAETDWKYKLMLWDTEREKHVQLGVSYPFEALQKGECILNSKLKQKGISVGDVIGLSVN